MSVAPNPILLSLFCFACPTRTAVAQLQAPVPDSPADVDSDSDGLRDYEDACPRVLYRPGFDGSECAPLDQNPDNDPQPECKARERVFDLLVTNPSFVTHVAFSIVNEGQVHFADAFAYLGQGNYVHDPEGIHRLYRIGSTTKSLTAVAAKIMEEEGLLTLDDFVSDEDGSQVMNGVRTLRQLLSHLGAFGLDVGALHLFCYPENLAAFWLEPDDTVSPHYDSATYGNLGGGFEYSAFNYSLAGTYMAHMDADPFEAILQGLVLEPSGMCTAMFDGARAVTTPIGDTWAVSEGGSMHVGPYINWVSPADARCEDNFYSSEDLPGDDYDWQLYRLDEADAEARDPAGGAMASVIDMAHFASSLLASYHGTGGLLSPQGVRELWTATSNLGCSTSCPYQPYYGMGFFTNSIDGDPVFEVEHGGSRPGYTSAFVLRPESNQAACILVNADVSTVMLSQLAKTILDDF